MEQGLTSYFFDNAIQNGFLTFTIGILFILTVFHFLLYFQQRDKLYLLYSGYTFFIIFSQLHHLSEGFLYRLFLPIKEVTQYPTIATEIYFIIYTLFAYRFLDIKKHLPNWYKWSFRVLYAIIAYCTIVFLLYLLKENDSILMEGYFYFTIPMTLFGIVMYIPFFKVKSPLKYYLIIGSVILLISSVWSLLYYISLQNNGLSIEPAYSILYLGFILENVLFSLGLGHKQKLILEDRNTAKNKLINQLKENEELRKKVQKQLEQDVEALNKQAEIEKLESIKIKYDKELAELKVSALRSQMNPHFIFNSLNSIKRYIIDNEKENAVFYLNKFSKLIRKILASTENRESTLEEEIETLKLYVNIENLRFNNTIDFKLDCDPSLNLASLKIPSLITQPFIENAIWHGLSLKKENRTLTVSLSKENANQVRFDIIDNGIGREKSSALKAKKLHKRDSLGVKLSEERLKHFSKQFEAEGTITFTDLYCDDKPSGTKVTILIPIG
ncbi:sensor histidine kinase [Psychroserpens sp. XS_ASV72]|uniref:sensor histidine kinase n=1 Tax=Psychroserpens sp. XS_ASV72 TaxID=3241293 RepID=UPI003514BA71